MYETLNFEGESNAFDTPIDGFDIDADNYSKHGLRYRRPGHTPNIHQVKWAKPRVKYHADQPKSEQIKFVPLEEHFENFVDVVTEVPENFGKFFKKLLNRRAAIKDKKKMAKADVIQAKADAERIRANADAQATILAAQQQAAQTNQLASAVNPAYANTQALNTPNYATLPDTASGTSNSNWRTVDEPGTAAETTAAAAPDMSTGKKPVTAADKKKKYIMFAVIALVVIVGVVYFMKRKK